MVYTSLPPYMDPANWHQQQPNYQVANTSVNTPLLIPPSQPPPSNLTPSQPHGGTIRPGSMADRARMANIPMQEPSQKCPRCDSTNTKFCYFNNYSLSQPRHFCKACRRYWTRGGALRSVPVGGGCRRNKRTKSSSNNTSKSPASSDRQTSSTNNSPAVLSSPTPPPMRFMAPLHHLGDHLSEIGLNYGFSGPMGGVGDSNFHIGSSLGRGVSNGGVNGGGSGGSASILPVGDFEQWRMPQTHQFPFLSTLEASSSSHGLLYPFEGGGANDQAHVYGGVSKVLSTNSSVKMEENQSRQFLGMINNNNYNNNNNNNNPNSEQYWSASAGGGASNSPWPDLSTAYNSSSATTNSNYRT